MDLKDMLKKKKQQQLTLDDKLFLDKFKVDNENPHLKIKDKKICKRCRTKECIYVCPVGNYENGDSEEVSLSWEECLECGSCRIACPHGAIEWNYPQGGFGIKYRYG